MLTFGMLNTIIHTNSYEDLLKTNTNITENMWKYMIVNYESLNKFLTNIPLKDLKSLKSLECVEDIDHVEIIDIYDDDHNLCTEIVFKDEEKLLRGAFLGWNNYAPGMILYYKESDKIKKDLINEINNFFLNKESEEEI